jgi:hypothetical protein
MIDKANFLYYRKKIKILFGYLIFQMINFIFIIIIIIVNLRLYFNDQYNGCCMFLE